MTRLLLATLAGATGVVVLVGGATGIEQPTSGAVARPVTRSVAASGSVAAPPTAATWPATGSGDGTRTRQESLLVAPTTQWRWPIQPRPPVLRRFRAPPGPYAAGHRGLDLAAAVGASVLAVDDGRVTHSGTVAGRGTVTVLHDAGLRSTYEPLDPVVTTGDVVTTGQVLGKLAAVTASAGTHCGPRPCLHLGAPRGGTYADPWPLLVGGRVVLLPLAGAP